MVQLEIDDEAPTDVGPHLLERTCNMLGEGGDLNFLVRGATFGDGGMGGGGS